MPQINFIDDVYFCQMNKNICNCISFLIDLCLCMTRTLSWNLHCGQNCKIESCNEYQRKCSSFASSVSLYWSSYVWSFFRVCVILAKSKSFDSNKTITLLRQYTEPSYRVTFCIYRKGLENADDSIRLGCCEKHNLPKLDEQMKRDGYTQIELFEESIHRKTKRSLDHIGRYRFVNGPVELT